MEVSRRVVLIISIWMAIGVPAAEPVRGDLTAQETLPLPPIDDFFQRQNEFQHTLSPNGQYLACIRYVEQSYAITVTDLETKSHVLNAKISRKYPTELTWLSDRRLIFTIGGVVWAINRDGEDFRTLLEYLDTQDKPIRTYSSLLRAFHVWSIVNRLPDDDEHILLKGNNAKGFQSVHRLNIYSGDSEVLYDGDKHKVTEWLVDNQGKARLAIRFRGAKASYYTVDTQSDRLNKLSDAGLKLDYSGKTYLDSRAFYSADAESADEIYVAENLSSGRLQIIRYNLRNGAREVILSDEKYDVGFGPKGATFLTDRNDRRLLGVRYVRDRQVTHWFDQEMAQVQNQLNELYPNKVNEIVDWTQDRSRVVFKSWDHLGLRVLVFIPGEKRIVVQVDTIPKFSSPPQVNSRMVSYRSGDAEIEAYLLTPNGEGPWPTVIVPHGGPFARTVYGYDATNTFFVSRGYAVLEPNFRGSTGYGREHLVAGIGGVHDVMIEDIAQGARWAIDQGIAHAGDVHIMGGSYGGYAALMSAVKYADLYSSAVALAAPVDIYNQLRWYKKIDAPFAQEFWRHALLNGKRDKRSLDAISPLYKTDSISIPVLVFHGDRDASVPKLHFDKMKERLEKKKWANPLIDMRMLKGEGHGVLLISNRIYVAERALALFKKSSRRQNSAEQG